MIAVIPVLFFALSSYCEVRSDESSDQGEALFPIVQSLKIPDVLMIGESINHVLYVHKTSINVHFLVVVVPVHNQVHRLL